MVCGRPRIHGPALYKITHVSVASSAISLAEIVPLLTCLTVISGLTFVTLRGKDAWPFSAYPMFAIYRDPPLVLYYFLRTTSNDGAVADLLFDNSVDSEAFHNAFGAAWAGSPSLEEEAPCRHLVESFLRNWARSELQIAQAQSVQVIVRIARIPLGEPPVVTEHSLGAFFISGSVFQS